MNQYIKEYKIYSEQADVEVLAYLISALLELGFKPKEPLIKFKGWFEKRIKKYNITGEQLEHCVDNYYDYWSESNRAINNFKTSFFNNPMLNRFLKEEYVGKQKNFYNVNEL